MAPSTSGGLLSTRSPVQREGGKNRMPRVQCPSPPKKRHCVQLRDPPSMPSSCAGMPLFTTQYAPNIKRRETLKSVTHRAYGPYALCVVTILTPSNGPHERAVIHLGAGGERAGSLAFTAV